LAASLAQPVGRTNAVHPFTAAPPPLQQPPVVRGLRFPALPGDG
jgi:hypothetical protein